MTTVYDNLANDIHILINYLSTIKKSIADSNKKLDRCLDIDTRMEDKYLKEDFTPTEAKTCIEIVCPNCGNIDKLWYDKNNFDIKTLTVKCKRCKEEYVFNYGIQL